MNQACVVFGAFAVHLNLVHFDVDNLRQRLLPLVLLLNELLTLDDKPNHLVPELHLCSLQRVDLPILHFYIIEVHAKKHQELLFQAVKESQIVCLGVQSQLLARLH